MKRQRVRRLSFEKNQQCAIVGRSKFPFKSDKIDKNVALANIAFGYLIGRARGVMLKRDAGSDVPVK